MSTRTSQYGGTDASAAAEHHPREASRVPTVVPQERVSIIPQDPHTPIDHDGNPVIGEAPFSETPRLIRNIARGIYLARYVTVFVWCAVAIGCAFPASHVSRHVSQDMPPPPDSQAARARQFYQQYFPQFVDTTGFVIYSHAIDESIDLSTDKAYTLWDNALQFWCVTDNYNFNRTKIPRIPTKVYTQVGLYSSYRSVSLSGMPQYVALQYLAAGNRSALITVGLNSAYTTENTTIFENALQEAIQTFTADYNLTGRVQSTLFSLPTFLHAISSSAEGDTQTMFFIVLPISLMIFAVTVSSGRLLILPIVGIAAVYSVSFAIIDGIASSTPINSLAPSICVFLILSYTMTYTYFFASQYRKQLKIFVALPWEELSATRRHRRVRELLEALYTTSGRSILLSCITVCLSGVGLTVFQTDLLRSLGIAMTVVILITMLGVLTLIPSILASFPGFFEKSMETWIHMDPLDIADPSGTDEQGLPLPLMEDGEDAAAKGAVDRHHHHRRSADTTAESTPPEPLQERWHLVLINFVSRSPQNYFLALLCIALCVAPTTFAFNGNSSNSLDQFMPKNELLEQWTKLQKNFRAGEVFSYSLLILPPTEQMVPEFSAAVFNNTQEIVYTMIRELPQTHIGNFDGLSIDGVEAPHLADGGNISKAAFAACQDDMSTAICYYWVMMGYGYYTSHGALQFLIRLNFDPVSDVGQQWYREAKALLPVLSQRYNYSMYLYGYGADSYDTVEYAQQVIGEVAAITVAIVFVCITVFFGSLVVPVKVVFSTFLAVASAYGVANLIYDHEGLNFLKVESLSGQSQAVAWQIPLVCLTICTGLVINLEVIVLIKIFDQRWHGIDSQVAVVRGVASVGREVSVAALMCLVNFGGLLANSIPAVNQAGVYFFVATAVEAFLIRFFLTPTLMSMFGQLNWWPMQFMTTTCTPCAVEHEAEDRPTLDDKEDFRRSVAKKQRQSVSGTVLLRSNERFSRSIIPTADGEGGATATEGSRLMFDAHTPHETLLPSAAAPSDPRPTSYRGL